MLIEFVCLHLQMHFVQCLMVVIGWVYTKLTHWIKLSLPKRSSPKKWRYCKECFLYLLKSVVQNKKKLNYRLHLFYWATLFHQMFWFSCSFSLPITFTGNVAVELNGEFELKCLTIKDCILIESRKWLIYITDVLMCFIAFAWQEKDARDIEIPNIRWEVFELMMRSNKFCSHVA
jgi:hypothetical protein